MPTTTPPDEGDSDPRLEAMREELDGMRKRIERIEREFRDAGLLR